MRDQAPIFRFNSQRPNLVSQTTDRVVETTDDPLHALNDAAYHESRRLDGSRRPKDIEKLEQWRSLARHLGRMSPSDRMSKVRELAGEHAEDTAGNFNPSVFRITTRLLPTVVTSLLAPRTLPSLLKEPSRLLGLQALAAKVHVQGDTEALRKLAEIGTLVFVPTHSSNLDSIVFGFALEHSGLPPATYGAGKNLFNNPLLSFFMHNLGAYKVDRRLRHDLYKSCLKAYSTVLMENGYHSLFFPGGTRSRSGAVEQKLKLGLVGTGIEAYTRTLIAGRERKVFFVPATINYLITLEAETLIGDYLTEAGKARYIIDDDESTRLGRITTFVRKLLTMNGSVVIRFGKPLDPFGSVVDGDGISHDRRGREVTTSSYVEDRNGKVCFNPAREAQYCRELGREIAAAYRHESVIMPTHTVAAACFAHLSQQAPSSDLFTVLRHRDQTVSRDDLAREVLRLRDELIDREKSGQVVVSDSMRACSGGDIVAQAMRAFRGYHTSPVIEPRPDGIGLHDTNLLYYYQNRLAAHGLGWSAQDAAGAPGAGTMGRQP